MGRDRAHALELHNGGERSIDRKKEGASVYVPNWSANIVGGIQPARLGSIAGDLTDDGLLQRFIVITARQTGEEQDREPNEAALETYRRVIRRLVEIRGGKLVTLSEDAHEWRRKLEKLAASVKILPGVPESLKAHLSKWRVHLTAKLWRSQRR